MPESYRIIVSERAKKQLGEHLRFIKNVSKTDAANTRKEITVAIRSLSSMPGRYPFLSEPYLPVNKYHKMVVAKRYLILYQIQDSTVYVDYIMDCRQDYTWLLH